MAVTYSKTQRERALSDGLHLATVAVPGFEFQGPVNKEEHDEIEGFLIAFLEKRSKRLRAIVEQTAPIVEGVQNALDHVSRDRDRS